MKRKNVVLAVYIMVLFFTTLLYCFCDAIVPDEAWTIQFSRMSNWEMIQATAADVHPPLYYMIVRLFFLLGGENYVLYHIISLIPYVIILLFAFFVAKNEFGYLSAVVLVTCNTVMKCAYTYNTQIRMYSWAELFVLLSFYELYLILKKDKTKNYILFVLFSLCAAYTHYYALISVAFFYLALYLFAIKHKNRWKKIIISSAVTIVAYLPWLGVLVKSFQRTAETWWVTKMPSIKNCIYFVCENKYIFLLFFFVIGMYVLYESRILNVSLSGQIQIYLKKFVWNCKVLTENDTSVSNEEDKKINNILIAAGLFSLAGTCLVGVVLSYLISPLFIERYLFPIAGVFWLIVGICMERLNGKKLWMLVFFVLILHFCVPKYAADYNATKQLHNNTKSLVSTVKAGAGENPIVLTNDLGVYFMAKSYYFNGMNVGCINIPGEENGTETIISRMFKDSRDTWVFLNVEWSMGLENVINADGYKSKLVCNGHFGKFQEPIYVYHLVPM